MGQSWIERRWSVIMKRLTIALIALILFPALTGAAALMRGTVLEVDKNKKEIAIKTEKGEESVSFTRFTKGVENIRRGATIKIIYTQKGEQLVASEIVVSSDFLRTSVTDR